MQKKFFNGGLKMRKMKMFALAFIMSVSMPAFISCSSCIDSSRENVKLAEKNVDTEERENTKKPGERIQLESLKNTRDLGGYKTRDGRVIKDKKLIRSGVLHDIKDNDSNILKNDYNLEVVVDLRSKEETSQNPDTMIDGVEYKMNPLVKRITSRSSSQLRKREESKGKGQDAPKDQVDGMLKVIKSLGPEPEKAFQKVYLQLVTEQYSIDQIAKFFDILLEERDGALLYHCTGGLDRTGTVTILLLSALGIDKETIIEDYMLANKYTEDDVEKIKELGKKKGLDDKTINQVLLLCQVDEEYIDVLFQTIDEKYGSMDNFLKDKIGLTDEKIEKLQGMYLE